MNDRLAWWEELPLGLATVAQSVVVGMWYYRSIDLGDDRLNLLVAIIAGLALDAIVVTTVMGRRVGRESGWSMGAAFGAFLCSALIAVDTYSAWLQALRPLLHVSYPLMVFLYSQHLATPRKTALGTLPKRLGALITVDLVSRPGTIAASAPVAPALTDDAPALEALSDSLAPALSLVEPSAYTCPHCERPLKSKQARGAATANGYCPACKAERRAAA